jgi:hypothetical protein
MRAIIKTVNPVILNYAEVLLRDAGIPAVVFDAEMSNMDGNLGILPRRVMVADEDYARALAVLTEGLGDAKLGDD